MASITQQPIVVVTGASSGIGWEIARQLAKQGYRVALIARRVELLHQLLADIEKANGFARVYAADVADRHQIFEAVRRIEEEMGAIDLMIANAGVGMPTLVDPVNLDDQERMIRVNFLGLVYTFAAVIPGMLRRRAGHLVGVSSLAGYVGLPGESIYCATKAAVNTYMDGLRIQLRPQGIRVTTICPGFIRTPMTAANKFHMPALLDADEAARRMIRAVHAKKRVYNFPWLTTLLIRMARRLPDRLLRRVMSDYNDAPPLTTPPDSAPK